jgi:hypothetical protein
VSQEIGSNINYSVKRLAPGDVLSRDPICERGKDEKDTRFAMSMSFDFTDMERSQRERDRDHTWRRWLSARLSGLGILSRPELLESHCPARSAIYMETTATTISVSASRQTRAESLPKSKKSTGKSLLVEGMATDSENSSFVGDEVRQCLWPRHKEIFPTECPHEHNIAGQDARGPFTRTLHGC